MDHQASESSFKVSLKKRSQFFLAVGLYVLSLPFTVLTCFADDPAPNPLIENITVTAIVLQNPSINPDTPPISNTGPINLVNTSDVAIFKGMAYPGSIISLLKNGILLANVPANPNGSFELHVRNLDPGTYTFGVRAQDATGLTSKLLTFTIFISTLHSGLTTSDNFSMAVFIISRQRTRPQQIMRMAHSVLET